MDLAGSNGAGEYEPSGPRPIKQLSRDVINQIAAAEVSQSGRHLLSSTRPRLITEDHAQDRDRIC